MKKTTKRTYGTGKVAPKKHLGQHFLRDENIAAKIVEALAGKCETSKVLEIGPGMGVLTKYLLAGDSFETYAIDIDRDSVAYLQLNFPELAPRLISGDFLHLNLQDLFKEPFSLIGNFPYNISSQIIFKILENKEIVPLMVGMFQKEVGERLCASPRTKSYGILSVLTQAWFEVEYLFTVNEDVFVPPPKVKSGVVRLIRKINSPEVDEKMFFRVVKTAFNQRRKKLRNALHPFGLNDEILKETNYPDKRAEELSVAEFIHLTGIIRQFLNNSTPRI